jgi:hypothetical protein
VWELELAGIVSLLSLDSLDSGKLQKVEFWPQSFSCEGLLRKNQMLQLLKNTVFLVFLPEA